MKIKLCIGVVLFAVASAWAQTNNLTTLLQQGLFEEQANRNLDAAIENYAVLARQFDKDRQIAATAVFRLGECYRAQGKTNEAAVQYQRILRDFADQKTLVTLSQQNLVGMGAQIEAPAANARQQQKELLAKQIALAEQDLVETQKLVQVGKAVPADTRAAEREVLRLKQQLAALDAGKVELLELSAPTTSEEDREIARIEKLIKDSPDLINKRDSGKTLLTKAAEAGQGKVVNYLLDHGADVNDGSLYYAVAAGNRAMAELLLQRGAKADWGGLHQAAQEGFASLVELLLAHKANPNAPDGSGQTPLFLAILTRHDKCARLLLAHGADPNIARNKLPSDGFPQSDGRRGFGTPLHVASANGDTEMVALLLTNRADVKALNPYSETPLQVAAASGQAEVAELLLAAGANPDARGDADADTPLHLATAGGFRNIVEKLSAHGANPNITAKGGVTPLMLAASGGNDDIARLLLQYKASPNLKDEKGNPALIRAIEAKQVAVVKTLLANGADPNVENSDGWSALMLAAGRNNPEIIAALIDAKADVNEVAGGNQMTALDFAAADGKIEIVKLLLNAKANVNTRDRNGDTPLHFAVRSGKDEVAALLLAAKADPNARNNYGLTPLDLAKGSGNSPGGAIRLGRGRPLIPAPAGVPTAFSSSDREQSQSNAPVSIADLLRQHGALDELPDFTRIRITRQGLKQPLEVFQAGANLTNQFTLLETVMRFYNNGYVSFPGQGVRPAWDGLPFPDFGRIIIRRPSPKIGGKETEITVSLLNSSNVVDCAKDVPVQFGDVIEIPESVHALNAPTPNPVQEMEKFSVVNPPKNFNERLQALTAPNMSAYRIADQCLTKSVQLVVAGETTTFKVNSWREGFLSQALGKTESRSVLRSSSDLARVKVTRLTGKPAKPLVFIVDASGNGAGRDDLWLQDGDVIEVPEKK